MSQSVIGWTDTYNNNLTSVPFTEDRKRAFVERIRKRRYSFTFDNYQYLPYCCPVFDDGAICVLTKQQFDQVMAEAWKDMPRGVRLMPMDAITIPAKNGVLYEKSKFMNKEDNLNV